MLLEQIEKAFKAVGSHLMAGGIINNVDNFHLRDDNVTSELLISPYYYKSKVIETSETLQTFTKQQICDLALDRFGIILNYHTVKKILMQQYLDLQVTYYQEGYI